MHLITCLLLQIAGTVGAATMNAENAKDSATETMKLINDLLQSMGKHGKFLSELDLHFCK